MAKKDDAKEEPEAEVNAPVAATPDQVVAMATENMIAASATVRKEMPRVRDSKTFSFKVSDSKGYFTVGEFEDGTPGELFISVSKMGSTLRGLMDAFAISVSHGLQYGVPLKTYVRAFSHMSFAPSGITSDPDMRTASSLVDYIFRRMALNYLSFDDRLELGLANIEDMPVEQTTLLDDALDGPAPEAKPEAVVASTVPTPQVSSMSTDSVTVSAKPAEAHQDESAPLCFNCGNQTQRAGSCYVCTSCGSTTGCS